MKKRFAAGLVTLLSVATLAACSTSSNSSIVTMKGDSITINDFYDEVKSSSTSQQSMLSLILSKVLEAKYGKDVTDKEVTAKYDETAKQYGDYFETALSQAGLTEESYKKEVRRSLLLEHAVTVAAEKELTDDVYKELYESYTPEVTAQVIEVSDQETANSVLAEVKAEGADFKKIAEEKSSSDTVEYTFDSSSTDLPTDVMNPAFKLDKDAISDVISVTSSSSYTTTYYIVKVTNKTEKDSDWKTYKKQLKTIYLNEKKNDSSYINTVLGDILKAANVKIKDDAFADVLASYGLGADATTTTAETTTTTADSTTAATDATTVAETTSAE
ncbi:peptidyl-prolyl cis-trans isomerase [Streptococcus caprae]|uniref:Foldase protein PrsA n=1 Tax=Streptococcus caprae TaxID=1640501 RepID=A0ABV8CW82_9STRE